jgi:hypothetical protein
VARKYLEEFGEKIARNGFEVIPIIPGAKRPRGEKWQKYDGSPEGIADYLEQGWGDHGVGIKSRKAPSVDIDILDASVNKEVQEIVREVVGESPLRRVGLPPKVLWVYRAEDMFPKVDTGEWFDPQGRKAKVEILADGQQFVAAHIHPDTGKPYQWLNGHSVLNTKLSDLPILTHEQAKEIQERSIKVFLGHGWVKKSRNAIQRLANPVDDDDPFSAFTRKVQIGDGELERRLMTIKDGSEHGFKLWDEWSQGAPNYDYDALKKRWPTFNNKDNAHKPISARIILKLSKDAAQEEAKVSLKEIIVGLENAMTTDEIVEVCEQAKKIEFPAHTMELLYSKVKHRWKDLTKDMPRIGFVRDLLRFESREIISAPPWAKHWIYLSQTGEFYHSVNRSEVSKATFNDMNARHVISPGDRLEGKATVEQQPSDLALNLYQIPVVYNRMYMPKIGPGLFEYKSREYINSYSDAEVPGLPGDLSPVHREAIQIFLDHFIHLFKSEMDRTILLDWIAYLVQNPGERINWAILLQGAEGDGKSFFRNILEAVMGGHVNGIMGTALEEKYNAWAEGAMLCFVEDVRLHGQNRFDAVNKLKPMITNSMVTIRRMQTDPYEVVNTMNYMATSNLKDAVPVTDEDSRFFPLFTRYQRPEDLDRFKAANPHYYRRLYGLCEDTEFAGAIRQFLLGYQISPAFDAKDRAPKSSYKKEMIMLNRSEEQTALRETIEESNQADYSEFLLESGKIADHFMGTDALAPKGKALNRLLSQHGFTLLGRFKVNEEKRQYWTMRPDAWPEDHEKRGAAIREYLDPDGL